MHTDSGSALEGSGQTLLVTALIYLNRDWQEGDGGELRVFPYPFAPQKIAPLEGRMVLFEPRMVHDVLPNFRRRRHRGEPQPLQPLLSRGQPERPDPSIAAAPSPTPYAMRATQALLLHHLVLGQPRRDVLEADRPRHAPQDAGATFDRGSRRSRRAVAAQARPSALVRALAAAQPTAVLPARDANVPCARRERGRRDLGDA